jgi:hypothetical protein
VTKKITDYKLVDNKNLAIFFADISNLEMSVLPTFTWAVKYADRLLYAFQVRRNNLTFQLHLQGPIFRTFSAEKVLKNRFFNKFRGIFRGKWFFAEKNVRKIGPRPHFRTKCRGKGMETMSTCAQHSMTSLTTQINHAPLFGPWILFYTMGEWVGVGSDNKK